MCLKVLPRLMKAWVRMASLMLLCVLMVIGEEAVATETPNYTIVASEGSFELRDYPSLLVAEVTVDGTRDDAANAAFTILAAYIFGENQPVERIGMTAPVTQTDGETIGMTAPVTQASTAGRWTVGFIMPARYRRDTLPRPTDRRIRIVEEPAKRVAAVRFSGRLRDSLFSDQALALGGWIMDRGLTPKGPPIYAYYNGPFTPGFLRRNEVMREVAR